MMGRLETDQRQFFYEYRLDALVPADHLVRKLDAVLDLSWLRADLAPYYTPLSRPNTSPIATTTGHHIGTKPITMATKYANTIAVRNRLVAVCICPSYDQGYVSITPPMGLLIHIRCTDGGSSGPLTRVTPHFIWPHSGVMLEPPPHIFAQGDVYSLGGVLLDYRYRFVCHRRFPFSGDIAARLDRLEAAQSEARDQLNSLVRLWT